MTQTQISDATGLSRATVAAVVVELRSEGRILYEDRASARRGRPPALLTMTQPDTYVGAVDLRHNHLSVAVASIDGELVYKRDGRFNIDRSGTTSIDAAARELRRAVTESGVRDLDYIMIGVPGPLEYTTDGSVRSGGVLSGWANLRPVERFREQFGTAAAIGIDNDAHLAAIGEHKYGAARGCSTALYVNISDGIGAGIIINDLLYRGGHGSAGEIGHIKVVEHGQLCRCGARGCLETVASIGYALRSLQAVHRPTLTVSDMSDLLVRGDASAVRLFTDIGEVIGRVVAITASSLDPEIIVVGSPLADAGPLLRGLAAALPKHTQPFVVNHAKIVPGELGLDASLWGAIARATRQARIRAAARN